MAGTKSRIFAIVFTVFMVVLALVYGPIRSLTHLSDDAVESVFSKNEDAISVLIEKKSGEAMNLTKLASRQMDPEDPTIREIKNIYNHVQLSIQDQDILLLFEQNRNLDSSIGILLSKMQNDPNFTNDDISQANNLIKQVEIRDNMISYNTYSQKAMKYNEAIKGFPAKFYTSIFGLKTLPSI